MEVLEQYQLLNCLMRAIKLATFKSFTDPAEISYTPRMFNLNVFKYFFSGRDDSF